MEFLKDSQNFCAERLRLLFADTRYFQEFLESCRLAAAEIGKAGVGEDHEGGHAPLAGKLAAPLPHVAVQRRIRRG